MSVKKSKYDRVMMVIQVGGYSVTRIEDYDDEHELQYVNYDISPRIDGTMSQERITAIAGAVSRLEEENA